MMRHSPLLIDAAEKNQAQDNLLKILSETFKNATGGEEHSPEQEPVTDEPLNQTTLTDEELGMLHQASDPFLKYRQTP